MTARLEPAILIVDDDPKTVGFLAAALEREDYVVLVALSGERALTSAQLAAPDIVLMDAMMPEMDGFETCRRLKRIKGAATVPVVFMTGLSETNDVLRGFEAGGVDYVAKPIVLQELLARLRVHLAGSRLVRSAHRAIDAAGHALFALDPAGRLIWATPGAERLLGARNAGMLDAAAALAPGERLAVPLSEGRFLEMVAIGQVGPAELLLRIAPARETCEEGALRARLPVTPREAEVLLWLTRGKANRDIADILGLSPRTVDKHLEQIFSKLGVENRAAAVASTLRALG